MYSMIVNSFFLNIFSNELNLNTNLASLLINDNIGNDDWKYRLKKKYKGISNCFFGLIVLSYVYKSFELPII